MSRQKHPIFKPVANVIKNFWRKSTFWRFPHLLKPQEEAISNVINIWRVYFCIKKTIAMHFCAGPSTQRNFLFFISSKCVLITYCGLESDTVRANYNCLWSRRRHKKGHAKVSVSWLHYLHSSFCSQILCCGGSCQAHSEPLTLSRSLDQWRYTLNTYSGLTYTLYAIPGLFFFILSF